MDNKEPQGYEYEWNMARFDFERIHILLCNIDELITNLRVKPRLEEIEMLYSCLRTLFSNLQGAFIPTVRADLKSRLERINKALIEMKKKSRPSLNQSLLNEFDDLHEQLMFARESAGLGVPRRLRLGAKEKLQNVV